MRLDIESLVVSARAAVTRPHREKEDGRLNVDSTSVGSACSRLAAVFSNRTFDKNCFVHFAKWTERGDVLRSPRQQGITEKAMRQ